jgi:hypothetical protein
LDSSPQEDTDILNSIPFETLKETLSQAGISISQIDRRIYLDAFFEIINIQKILYHKILFMIQGLPKEATSGLVVKENVLSVKEVWKQFIERVQLTIQNHLNA